NVISHSIYSSIAQQVAVDAVMRCADLKLAAARLACYDKVTAGEEVTLGREKVPLDLAGSVKASFSDFRPTAVFAAEEDEKSELAAEAEGVKSPGAPTAVGNERLAKAGVTVDDFAAYTPLSLAYDLDKNSEQGTWTVRPHNPIYLLPAYVQYDPNRHPKTPTQDPTEAQFEDYGNK